MNIGTSYNQHLNAVDYKVKYINNIFNADDMTDNVKTLYPDKKSASAINYGALQYVKNLKSATAILKEAIIGLRSVAEDAFAEKEPEKDIEKRGGFLGPKNETAEDDKKTLTAGNNPKKQVEDAYNVLYKFALDNDEKVLLDGLGRASKDPALKRAGITFGTGGEMKVEGKEKEKPEDDGQAEVKRYLERLAALADDIEQNTGKYMGGESIPAIRYDNMERFHVLGVLYDIAV